MKKITAISSFLYAIGSLALFAIGSIILQRPLYILFLGLVISMFSALIIVLATKLGFIEKQNKLNLERFTISLEHISNVLFDNVLEADITNDCLIGENASALTTLLNIPSDSSYSKTIDCISRKMVQADFSEEYRKTLSPQNVLKIFEMGSNMLEYECIERSDGEHYRWIRVNYCIYNSNVTNCVKIISYVKNIDEEKRAYTQLIEKASTDQMTGLLNKTSTKEIVSDLLKKHADESNTILMIDIDDFKSINDKYGHNVGDDVIVSICGIIKKNFRETDIIGRMGGDEFLVCLRENFASSDIQLKVMRLLTAIQAFSYEYNHESVSGPTVSIGLVNTFGNENFDQLYHYADTAMYTAKMKGKNQYSVYVYSD